MIKNICLVDTPYALSIYLLKMSMEDINSTLFFVGDSVNVKIAEKLPHYALLRNQSAKNDWKYMSWLRFYKYFKYLLFPFANLYVQDHLYIASQIIGPYKYVNLPDGPDCYHYWEKCPYQPSKPIVESFKRKIKYLLSHGAMYDLKYGTNDQCINRWVTTKNDINSKYLVGTKYEYIDAYQLWNNSATEKQTFIMNVFGITSDLLNRLSNINILILTQPLREDCKLTNEEMYNVYAPEIKKDPQVAIKTHPRDKFDWHKYFENAYLIDTYAPMQLLNYMGFNPQIAITISSSSISAMPRTTKKIYLGTKVHPKVYNTYGDLYNAQ